MIFTMTVPGRCQNTPVPNCRATIKLLTKKTGIMFTDMKKKNVPKDLAMATTETSPHTRYIINTFFKRLA